MIVKRIDLEILADVHVFGTSECKLAVSEYLDSD
jgi:hypothetical protein